MNILITGASGFLGSAAATFLSQSGYQVIATCRSPSSSLKNQLDVEILELDVLDPQIPSGINADVIIHCATANDTVSRDFNAGVTLSVQGTWNLLKLCNTLGARHFIYLSTFQVYGTELEGHYDENSPVLCESPYALNHFLGEQTCRSFHGVNKPKISIVRPSNVFGRPVVSPLKRQTLVPLCLVRQALTENKISLKSSGQQMRNFVSLEEFGKALAHIVASQKGEYEIFNVCSNYHESIMGISSLVQEICASETGCRPSISVDGNSPLKNTFSVASRLSEIQYPEQTTRAHLRSEIAQMITYYQKHIS